jgi:hypothetical protein
MEELSMLRVRLPVILTCILVGASALFSLWFLGFSLVIPFADLHGEQGPVPWWGRLYMVGASLILAGILAAGFVTMGRPMARKYFGLLPGKTATINQ